MKIFRRTLAGILFLWSVTACSQSNFISDFEPVTDGGNVRVVIEIPAGTTAKWEVTKPLGKLEWEQLGRANRIVDYVAYPGVREILEIWFSNYKGLAITNSTGYGDAEEARKILNRAIADYLVCDCE